MWPNPAVVQITQGGIRADESLESFDVLTTLKFVPALLAAVAIPLGFPVAAEAAPKNYCSELKGAEVKSGDANTRDAATLCRIQMTDPGYTVSISFPANYPDMKAIADFVGKTRDQFLDVAKSSTPRDEPYALDITSTSYNSLVPPRGQLSVVLKVYQSTGGAHPRTSFQSFVWDQTYRKPVTYETLWQPKSNPLPIVFPVVQADLQKQTGQPVVVAPDAGLDPANYQNFAITNEGVIFFFSQGTLLPEAAGATQVLVPRSVIDPLLA